VFGIKWWILGSVYDKDVFFCLVNDLVLSWFKHGNCSIWRI